MGKKLTVQSPRQSAAYLSSDQNSRLYKNNHFSSQSSVLNTPLESNSQGLLLALYS